MRNQSVMMEIEGKVERKMKGEGEKRIGRWDERGREEFKRKMGEIARGDKGIHEEIREVGRRIREVIKEGERRKERGKKGMVG